MCMWVFVLVCLLSKFAILFLKSADKTVRCRFVPANSSPGSKPAAPVMPAGFLC